MCTRTLLWFSIALMGVEPAWTTEETAKRPSAATISQWQSRKFGMFIHFGLYSTLGGIWKGKQYSGNYSEQIQSDAHIPESEYAQLATQFNPTTWNPDEIVRLARETGMQFIVITSKHHDGFNMFHTHVSPFNIVDATPYKQDIVKGLSEACARAHMPFGVYYSTIDWHFGDTPEERNDNPISPAHEEFNAAQLRELMTGYGPISEIWFDMGHPTEPQSEHFASTVHSLQPETMIAGRIWNNQGDFMEMGDDDIPDYVLDEPWESPSSIYQETWGYRSWQKRTDLEKKTEEHILRLVSVASRGGNYILNIGPQGDGSVVPFEADVLHGVGAWLKVNGEAIYNTEPQPFRKLEFGHATSKGNRLFQFVERIPASGYLELPGLTSNIRKAYLLSDAAKTPLRFDNVKKTIAAPAGSGFLPVVVVDLDTVPRVIQPAVQPNFDNTIVLAPETADRFFNRNGEGYYDPPALRKLQWHFAATSRHAYRIEIAYKPGRFAQLLDLDIGGKLLKITLYGDQAGPAIAGTIELPASRDIALTVNPAAPAARGRKLDCELTRISLIPTDHPH